MKAAVVVFPGINRERDMARALKLISGREPAMVWHADTTLPAGTDLVVVPGGFSYGDYLRCGAIARFAPIMESLVPAARDGLPVLGVCNGFQILCESHLLPGALTRNAGLHFVCRDQRVRVDNAETAWTREYAAGQELVIPIKNIDGCYTADAETLAELESAGRVVARYVDVNPNGSLNDIAGICNEAGNVVGLMPHPEHAVESLTGPTTDGLGFFASVAGSVAERLVTAS